MEVQHDFFAVVEQFLGERHGRSVSLVRN
jgi:hypothetical protein